MDPKFQDRLDERLSWRGSTTGIEYTGDKGWKSSHRIRLVGWANERNGTASVLQSTKSKNDRVGEERQITKARLNPAMLDVTFTAHPCSQAICEIIKEQFEFRNRQDAATAGNYKYVLDVSVYCVLLQFYVDDN